MKSSDVVNKTFYLTGLFSDIKTDHNWTTNETKMALLLFQKLSKHRIYIPDFDKIDGGYDILMKNISSVPLNYTITKNDFKDITNIQSPHLAREIKKVIKGLLSKVIIMPSPIEKHNKDSLRGSNWFSKIDYLDGKGIIDIEINKYSIEKLVAISSYSKIKFENIVKIQNHNAIYSYIFFKILRDYHKFTKLEIPIIDFKEKLGLKDKYKITKTFKDKVLTVIQKEISNHSDLFIEYELIKEGKGFTKIKFTFDYKPEYMEKSNKTKNKKATEPYYSTYDSLFESTLVGWGIRAKRVGELEEEYSLDVIQSAIDKTLEKEKNKEIKTTKASVFLGILANKQIVADEIIDREHQEIAELEKKEILNNLGTEYNAIQKVINDNCDEISNYLSAKSINTTYKLNSELNEQLLNMSCVDNEKFKKFRPKLPVLHNGYYDMKIKKEVRPNMYQFLNIISKL
jgi:plasmid replication initiation protein